MLYTTKSNLNTSHYLLCDLLTNGNPSPALAQLTLVSTLHRDSATGDTTLFAGNMQSLQDGQV